MNTRVKQILLGLLIFGCITGILLAVIHIVLSERESELDNPYTYDISALEDTAAIPELYTETAQIWPGLSNLTSIAIGPDDLVYVTASGWVQVYDRTGMLKRTWPLDGTPECSAVGPDGTVYLGMLTHVEAYNPDGTLKHVWPELEGEAHITAIAIEGTNSFIADYGSRKIVRCDMSGRPTGIIGAKDAERDIPGFVIPSPYFDCIPAGDGTIWAVNPGRHLLQNFTPEGDLRSSWGSASMGIDGFCGCCNPTYIALLSDGSFVTSEKGLVRVKVYKADGEFAGLVAGSDMFDEGTTGLDLAVDSTDRIYVLDPYRGSVRIFERK